MKIKSSTVTREQYDRLSERFDRLESDYDLVKRNHIEYANWSRARLKDMQPKQIATVAWIVVAVLAVLSSAQSIAIFFFC